ncbi:MAG TPA: hypothetical protein VHW03_09065 [Chthoniobacterales bacterium]|jgi:hypothetical protein|nr:hypothetical protein [Chthoniobacterales bacterium]
MKTKIALCLLAAALLPACTTTRTASNGSDAKGGRYSDNTAAEAAPPAEGPTEDIPAEGPRDVGANPAYVPTPLLRRSAASQP